MGKKKKLKAKIKALKAQLAAAAAIQAGTADPAPKVSPLAPKAFPKLPVIAGARFATAMAGVRYAGRTDVMLAHLAPGSVVAGTFTRSATRAASVRDAQAKLGVDSPNGAAILVNSGNANAFTGAVGGQSVEAIAGAVSDRLDLPASRVFTASTGVIGEALPHERITATLDGLSGALREDALPDAARAIMTTDTYPKGAGATVTIGGQPVQIAGIAKGSGMIAPDMATMLVYIFTDAKITQAALQSIVSRGTDASFNCITVDSDTSTSDMLLVAATGASDAPMIDAVTSDDARTFADALRGVMLDLAHQVVRDGEGATKFVEVAVTGARSDADARRVAMAIANSPLVKTAVAGEDPNWGRVVMAIGKSGAEADRDRLSIRFGPHLVAYRGQVAPSYAEEIGAAYMQNQELVIGVDMRLGVGAAKAWTCDLTNRYIEINADYRS
ncbi:MAG: bifunctional glutamate N-acetyltransferase/amino-acid acetyltransferase ArgJ [Alphaproteobacteria bacterium]|jgi:glutamate N-acetyltransferase/amino-acid N-acetyltransferase|nr:bifunctional glutamate N-acetyltransferase/amino-acid acetyltransferase ArgJ [Alphaproteobacteria bacterium]